MRYSFESRIRYSETDEQGRLSLTSLVDYFQDCATFQSEDLGLGISYLRERGRAWILASWQIRPGQMPVLGDKIRVTTWAYEFRGFYGMRNFLLTNEAGQTAADAASVWVMFDLRTQQPVRILPEEAARYEAEAPLEMPYAPRKITVPKEMVFQTGEPVVVTEQHLDTNHHVNNGQYLAMAVNAAPGPAEYAQVRMQYLAQARKGDCLLPRIGHAGGETIVRLDNSSDPAHPFAVAAFHERES